MSAGLVGSVDFVGYPMGVGQPVPLSGTPHAGLHGLIDFVGYPVGGAVSVALAGKGKGFGGKRFYSMMLQMEMDRSVLDRLKPMRGQMELERIARGEIFKNQVKKIEKKREKRKIEAAVYTVLLSEV